MNPLTQNLLKTSSLDEYKPYYILKVGDSSTVRARGMAVDTNGDIYVCGESAALAGSGYADACLIKLNKYGNILWQKVLGTTGDTLVQFLSVAIDSTGNVYTTGASSNYVSPNNSYDIVTAKHNSNGVLQWQRTMSSSNTTDDRAYEVAIDSSDNIYIVGYTNTTGNTDTVFAKYNTSGTLLWQRRLGSTLVDVMFSCTIDSLNNIYLGGYSNSIGTNSYDFYVTKYDSSGVIQWQRLIGSTAEDYAYDIASDSLNNVYICGEFAGPGTGRDAGLVKYGSDGTLLWSRTFGGSSGGSYGSDQYFLRVFVDSLDNIYTLGYDPKGYYSNIAITEVIIVKWDSSGSVIWQRKLRRSYPPQPTPPYIPVSSSISAIAMDFDSNNDIYVCTTYFELFHLPADGSKTGEYVDLEYFTAAYTNGATTNIAANTVPTWGDVAGTLTEAAGTLTSSDITLPSSYLAL